jgi:hypothetical protein
MAVQGVLDRAHVEQRGYRFPLLCSRDLFPPVRQSATLDSDTAQMISRFARLH